MKENRDNIELNELERGLLESMAEFEEALSSKGKLQDKLTMRRVELQLEPCALDAEFVKTLRSQFYASQTVFAKLIGISASTLKSWEQGIQTPPAWASRLLSVMREHPEPWKEILEKSTTVKNTNEAANGC